MSPARLAASSAARSPTPADPCTGAVQRLAGGEAQRAPRRARVFFRTAVRGMPAAVPRPIPGRARPRVRFPGPGSFRTVQGA